MHVWEGVCVCSCVWGLICVNLHACVGGCMCVFMCVGVNMCELACVCGRVYECVHVRVG
jgi:hypothetical protein